MYAVRAVTDHLYWVGANDHRTHLFENIHPIPYGVSYNSYLLLDQSTVLFDAVDWSACRQLMENLDHLLGGRPLDYLVVNHVEPDHGASIGEILLRWPNVKLVSTAKAFAFLRQFGVFLDGHELVTVKEGDARTFGTHTLTFLAAPMVHWPEVMVTFDTTNGVLFSADAFGSFIALDGKLFADEVDFDRDWLGEARRYYTNIVGKYGLQVQALLKKAAGILDQIKFICPLHGPVWRENFGYLIDKYDKWSKYQPEEEGVLIACASMYGNTESAAQALAAKLVEKGCANVRLYDVSSAHVSQLVSEAFRLSHLVFACVTYNGGIYPVMHDFLAHLKGMNLQDRTCAILENGTWAATAGNQIQKFLETEMKGMAVLGGRTTLASALKPDQAAQLDALADAIIASMGETGK